MIASDLLAPARGETLLALLRHHLPPRPPPLSPSEAVERLLAGCPCGNPVVTRDKPCAACGATPVSTRAHPEQCPRCGSAGDVFVAAEQDFGEMVIAAACHGAVGRARFRSSDIVTGGTTFLAEKVAEAIAALGDAVPGPRPPPAYARPIGAGHGGKPIPIRLT